MKLGNAALIGLLALSVAGCAVTLAEDQMKEQCAAMGKQTFVISSEEDGIPLVFDSGGVQALCVGPDDVVHMPARFGADVVWSSSFKGVGVMSVASDSIAGHAGISAEDILVEYGGQAILRPDDLQAAIENTAAGARIPIALSRNGKKVVVTAQF